jgi:hypothetical protein
VFSSMTWTSAWSSLSHASWSPTISCMCSLRDSALPAGSTLLWRCVYSTRSRCFLHLSHNLKLVDIPNVHVVHISSPPGFLCVNQMKPNISVSHSLTVSRPLP